MFSELVFSGTGDNDDLGDKYRSMYIRDEKKGRYVLKDEYTFKYDDVKGEAVFNFTMSFRDLPSFEDYEDVESKTIAENSRDHCILG